VINESNDPHEAPAASADSSTQGVSATPMNVWARIKEHKVAQWTLAYAAAALALLEGAKLVSEAFEWPPQVVRIATVVLILGVPLVVTLAWFHGHRALRRASGAEMTVIAVLLAVAGGVLWHFARTSHESVTPQVAATRPTVATFSPPTHSIAVLPFVNMSGDKEQEYFSEGLTEELLNSLARLDQLHVAARTSSFSFQGEHPDIATVAHRLNVGTVMEGSVRRDGHTVRITAQLVDGVTGFHIWSQTYDRDLKDVLKLQTEIATAVAGALEVTLLGEVATKIELGGTRIPAAFDAYLKASKAYQSIRDEQKDLPNVIAAYTEAIHLDPRYALAFASRAYAFATYAADVATGSGVRENFERAESDARQALALAPELAEAHRALAYVLASGALDFAGAQEEYERAMIFAPGNAKVLRDSGWFAADMGRFETAIAALRRAVVLDPLDGYTKAVLGEGLYAARRYSEAATAFAEAVRQNPDFKHSYGDWGLALYGLGSFDAARASCEAHRDDWHSQECLAVVYKKLGRHADAKAELKKMQTELGDAFAYEYTKIYAEWGDKPKALEWLETAMRLRDPGLVALKVESLLDPLRQEPRFQAVMRELKFPD
jgi:serine/threonine-protein kinase